MDPTASATDLLDLWQKFSALAGRNPGAAYPFALLVTILLWVQIKDVGKTLFEKKDEGWPVAGRILFAVMLVLVPAVVVVLSSTRDLPPLSIVKPTHGAAVVHDRLSFEWRQPAGLSETRYEVEWRRPDADELLGTRTVPRRELVISPEPGPLVWRVRCSGLDDAGTAAHTEWSDWHRIDYYRSTLGRIKSTGIVRIGLPDHDFPPFISFDDALGRRDGLDLKIAEILAQGLGKLLGGKPLEIRWETGEFLTGNAADLHAGRADFVVAQTAIQKERESTHQIRFSKPYLRAILGVLSRSEKPLTAQNVRGHRLGAHAGTTGAELAQLLAGDSPVATSQSTETLTTLLDEGKIDGIIDDYIYLKKLIEQPTYDSTRYSVAALNVADVPEQYRRRHGYPTPVGAYVNYRSGKLLQAIDTILKLKSTRDAIAEQVLSATGLSLEPDGMLQPP